MEILHINEIGDTESVVTNVVYLVIGTFVHVHSDALPLYTILKQSEIGDGDIAFQKIWGIQKVSLRMQLF